MADIFSVPTVGSTLRCDLGTGSILGGYGNCVQHNYAGVFGCCVTTALACAFHANTYNAQNMCNATGGLTPPPSGTLYYCVLGPGCCAVYIS